MKSLKLSASVFIVIIYSVFASTTASGFSHFHKLRINSAESKNADNTKDKSGSAQAGKLPINKQAWLLLIAGGAIGCRLIIKKSMVPHQGVVNG